MTTICYVIVPAGQDPSDLILHGSTTPVPVITDYIALLDTLAGMAEDGLPAPAVLATTIVPSTGQGTLVVTPGMLSALDPEKYARIIQVAFGRFIERTTQDHDTILNG